MACLNNHNFKDNKCLERIVKLTKVKIKSRNKYSNKDSLGKKESVQYYSPVGKQNSHTNLLRKYR